MNKWLRRAAGTVGLAGGMLLLAGGAAHADAPDSSAALAQSGLLHNLFTPLGTANLGLSADVPGSTIDMGLVPDGPLGFQPNNGQLGVVAHTLTKGGQPQDFYLTGQLPDVLSMLPVGGLVPTGMLNPIQSAATGSVNGVTSTLADTASTATGLQAPDSGVRNVASDVSQTLVGQGESGSAPTEGLPIVGGLVDNLPLVGGLTNNLPVVGGLMGGDGSGLPIVGGLVNNLPLVGGLANNLPLVGGLGESAQAPTEDLPVVGGLVDNLPLVGGLVNNLPVVGGLMSGGAGGGLPIVGSLPVVGGLMGGGAGGGLPIVGSLPVVGGLMGGGAGGGLPIVGSLPVVGGLASGLPVVGGLGESAQAPTEGLPIVGSLPVVGGLADNLPVVGGLMGGGDSSGIPVVGSLPVVGGLMGGAGSSDSSGGSLPAIGGLPVVGSLPVVGGLANNLPLVGGLTNNLPVVGGLANQLPIIGNVSSIGQTMSPDLAAPTTDLTGDGGAPPAISSDRSGDTPDPANGRPVADGQTGGFTGMQTNESASATEGLPLVGSLPIVGGLANNLPVVGSLAGGGSSTGLPVIGGLMNNLPLVGGLTNNLPVVGGMMGGATSASANSNVGTSMPVPVGVVQSIPITGLNIP